MRTSRFALLLLVLAVIPGCSLGDEPSTPPQLGPSSGDEEAATKLGFPASATKNTLRVGGGDPAADAAGVANAVFPGTSTATRPTAVVLVDSKDWQAAVTASVLTANPIGAPLLLSDGDELPAVTADTLERLRPKGSDLSKDAQVIRIGDAPARPDGLKAAVIEGKDPYARAASIDRFFSAARGRPSSNVIVASGEQAQYAMPAGAWAARSGDSVLLTRKDELPEETRKALAEHEKPRIFVLGPEKVISDEVVDDLRKLGRVKRAYKDEPTTPVENSIEFARYEDDRSDFGWGVTVPGHNFTVANSSRPLDAAAAASLATKGVYAPLLLTDQSRALPRALEAYFLSVQPGFDADPGDAVYNRVWILGDEDQLSVGAQARLDQITELIPVEANTP
jgi:hypothetical protein